MTGTAPVQGATDKPATGPERGTLIPAGSRLPATEIDPMSAEQRYYDKLSADALPRNEALAQRTSDPRGPGASTPLHACDATSGRLASIRHDDRIRPAVRAAF